MRKLPVLFLLGFVITYVPLIYLFTKIPTHPTEVLAEETEAGVITVVLQTLAPHEATTSAVLASADEEIGSEAVDSTPQAKETPTPVPTPTPDVWSPPHLEGWFAQYAGQYGVDKNVLERLANCESHFNPSASNGDYLGMFQFSTRTWQDYRMKMGLDANPDLRTNPEESIKTAAYVIQQRGTAPWPACLR